MPGISDSGHAALLYNRFFQRLFLREMTQMTAWVGALWAPPDDLDELWPRGPFTPFNDGARNQRETILGGGHESPKSAEFA